MTTPFLKQARNKFVAMLMFAVFCIPGCDSEDPKPVNEEEVITTLEVTLVPGDGGAAVTLKFYDADGEFGSVAPVVTVSGPLKAGVTYAAAISLLNETNEPAESISEEIAAEADAHLFCFTARNLEIAYADEDENGLAIGLLTSWTAGAVGPAAVEITLRHQPGTKTGACPGTGETDAQVSFQLQVTG